MEIIRKQISLDKCLNHVNGYRPFVPFNPSNDYYKKDDKIIENCDSYPNLNYKQFVCDIKTDDGVIVKYLDIMSAYNLVLDEVRKGIFIYYDGKVYHTINYRDNNIKISDNLIKINLKGCNIKCDEWVDIQDIKPLDIDKSVKIDEYTYKFDDEIESDEEMDSENEYKCVYYVLIKNFDKVKKLADFYLNLFGLSSKSDRFNDSGYYLNFIYFVKTKFIDSKNYDDTIKYDCVIPTVDIPVMLEEECTYDTMYQTYEYTYDGLPVDVNINGETFKGINGSSIIEFNNEVDDLNQLYQDVGIKSENKLIQSYQDVDIKVESKLMQLIHPETIDINENLSGLLNEYSNELFEVVKKDGVWSGTTILSSYTAEELSCVDNIGFSDNVVSGITEYMNIPFLSCLNTKEFENYPDGKYVFSVKYQNDENNKLKIPFEIGYTMNKTTYSNGVITYDTINKITYNTKDDFVDTVTIEYTIGAESENPNSGIMYQETLDYISGETEVYFDGYDNVKIYYENIDFNTNKMTIFNNEYGVYTDVKMSKIIKMPIQDIWSSNNIVVAPLFTKENIESLYNIPKIDVGITFNRGNAAGWEKHFKLSECNTMKDLEQYGNNFFNL